MWRLHFTQQDGTTVTELRNKVTELMARIERCDGLRAIDMSGAGQIGRSFRALCLGRIQSNEGGGIRIEAHQVRMD